VNHVSVDSNGLRESQSTLGSASRVVDNVRVGLHGRQQQGGISSNCTSSFVFSGCIGDSQENGSGIVSGEGSTVGIVEMYLKKHVVEIRKRDTSLVR